jgi:SAM-dependent methyltransferase
MISAGTLLAHPVIYRVWQSPFARDKFAPVVAHNDLTRVRRVLDVGCGPGTNVSHFSACDYVGIDVNPRYIEYARRRYGRTFLVADATRFEVRSGQAFDFILLNSFLHHIDTENVSRILTHLCNALTDDGHIHILDLVLPESSSLARLIAKADRGNFPRRRQDWHALFSDHFEIVTFEAYTLSAMGIALWHMLYCRGRAKR